MPSPEAVNELRLAVKRFLALDKTWGVVDHFRRDWATSDRHGDSVESARDRMIRALERLDSGA